MFHKAEINNFIFEFNKEQENTTQQEISSKVNSHIRQ